MSLLDRIEKSRWLPYRLRAILEQNRIVSNLRCILNTKPVAVVNGPFSIVELHMLLCKRDFLAGLVALKSFLKAVSGPISVSITSDGTLTHNQRALTDQHLPGVRWLEWPLNDGQVREALKKRPELGELYRSNYPPVAKLLHPLLLAKSNRVIVLDPDTVAWRRLDLLNEWILGGMDHDFHLEDLPSRRRDVPREVAEGFRSFHQGLRSEFGPWKIDNLFFNSGLLAFHIEHMNLDVAEHYLRWHKQCSLQFRSTMSDIWFGPWTPEQTCFLVMFATSFKPMPFGSQYVLGYEPSVAFNHFLRSGLVRPDTLKHLGQFIRDEL